MDSYPLALFAHIIVVVYLLGADLGRACVAGLGAGATASAQARLLAARATLWLGSVTNAALILILPAGISLAAALGVYQVSSPGWLTATWIVSAGWLALSVAADRSAGHPGGGGGLAVADAVARLIIGAGHVYDGAIAFAGTSTTVEAWWLAGKIALYGLLIIATIPVRRAGFAIRREAALLGAVPDDSGASARLGAALARLRTPLLSGWTLILLAAWLGSTKPA